MQPRLVEGRVLGPRAQKFGIHHEGCVEIDEHEVCRRSLGEAAARQPKQARGVRGQRPKQRAELDAAVMIEAERRRQQRLDADGAVGGLGEGAALASASCGSCADTITSMSPLAMPSTMAARSSSERSGAAS